MNIAQIKELLTHNPTGETLDWLLRDKRSGVQKLLLSYQKKVALQADEEARLAKLYEYEDQLSGQGFTLVAGVDEAGRGPLAGPLVVAAAILRRGDFFLGLNDSKQVSAKKREELYGLIMERVIASNVQIIPPAVIDKLNIYQATLQGMRDALLSLTPLPEAALIDAMPLTYLPFHTISLIHGDALSASIAAASILAKVTRDRLMVELAEKYPQYAFEKHKGYGSKEHMEAIFKYGPTPEHRMSFEPLKSMLQRGGLI